MKTTISFRIDDNTKKDAEAVANALGLDLSSTVRVFLSQFILSNGFPFRVNLSPFNNDTLEAIADEGEVIKGEDAKAYLDNLKAEAKTEDA